MRLSRIAAGLVALVGLAACGADPSDVPQQSAPPSAAPTSAPGSTSTTATTPPTTAAAASAADSIRGKTYVSTDVQGFTLVPGSEVRVTFDGDNVSANAGCNTLASTWSLEGDVLVVPPMAQTQMACTPTALMDQDTWLHAVLTSRPTLAVDGDKLAIMAQGATLAMIDQAAANPPQQLEGPTWTVEAINTASASSTVPAGVRPPTLTFQGGTVAVDTGCNTGSGSYTLGDGTVTFGPIATTRMACVDPAGGQVEQQVLAVLTGTATYAIEGDTLTLTNGANGLVLGPTPTATTTTAAG
jgi:heat shock protein HslJ